MGLSVTMPASHTRVVFQSFFFLQLARPVQWFREGGAQLVTGSFSEHALSNACQNGHRPTRMREHADMKGDTDVKHE